MRSLCCVLLCSATAFAQSDREFVRDRVLGALEWRALGPTTFGGRIVDIEVDPTRNATWFIASGSGGLFKTTNAGNTFTPIFDDQPVISIGDIAIAPSDPDVIYVGTGEANNQRSSYWGNGVYRSADGGETWTHTGLDGTDHIGRIIVHPSDANTAWVAALGALYTPNDARGLYRTRDGGSSWECVKHIDADVGFVDVVLEPGNPDTLFAASYERRRRAWNFDESGPGSAIWKSTDGGDTWTRLEGGLPSGEIGRIGLSVCGKQPNVVYAIVENRNPSPKKTEEEPVVESSAQKAEDKKDAGTDAYNPFEPWFDEYAEHEGDESSPGDRRPLIGGEVYRSDDGGETWTKHHEKNVGGRPHYYYGQVRVDPNNADRAIVLGVAAWQTSDGGKEWKANFQSRLHVDAHALWIDPSDSLHSLIGNDGGLAETFDGGKTWRYINTLPLAQFYAVSVDTRRPYTIYGGTQDNGSWAIPSRTRTGARVDHHHTAKLSGGDGFYTLVDPEQEDIVYSESQFGGLQRWNRRTGERASLKPKPRKGEPDLRFNWMSPLAVSTHAPQTIYFGSQFVHRSRNRGDDWEVISPDLSTRDADRIAGDVAHCTVSTLAESPHDADWLLAGTDDGKVWITKTGGRRWTDLTERIEGVPARLWVSRVAFSPSDPDTAYVSFTGYREDHRAPYLFVTTDAGETFRPIHNDLPRSSINVVREHPRNPNVLFVGHEFGVHVSIDGGSSWLPLGAGLPTNPVHDLLVHPREPDLVLGTHGRGIFVLDITSLEQLDEAVLAKSFHAFPPRDGHVLEREYPIKRYPGEAPWRADPVSERPQFAFYLREDSDEKVLITVYDITESVVFELDCEGEAGLHTVEWRQPRGDRQRRRAPSPRAGEYLVLFEHGEARVEYAFHVHPSADGSTGLPAGDAEDVHEERDDGDL